MTYIKFHNKNFDFGFEEKSPDEIIEFLTKLFKGKRVNGKYKTRLQLKSWEDKKEFWDKLKDSKLFHCYIDNRLTKAELELLLLKIAEGFNVHTA